MGLILIILFVINTIIFISNIMYKKKYFSPTNFAYIFLVLNYMLVNMKWSLYICESFELETKFIFCVIMICNILFFNIEKSYKNKEYSLQIKSKKKLILLINIVYVVLYLTENYLLSNKIFPSFSKIDVHLDTVIIIGLITRNLYPFILINFLGYIKSKEKKFIIWILIIISIPILTRNSRSISLIALISLIIMIVLSKAIKFNIKKVIIGITSVMIFCILGVNVANLRMNQYGRFQFKYENLILYDGPKFKNETINNTIAMYYGYFPLSINNLNLSIKNIKIFKQYTYGTNLFAPILTGILQLDNIIPGYYKHDEIMKFRSFNTTAATIPTGFYWIYLDFGHLSYVIIVFIYMILIFVYNKIYNNKFFILLYPYLLSAWGLMIFQNYLFEASMGMNMILIYLISKIFIYNDILNR